MSNCEGLDQDCARAGKTVNPLLRPVNQLTPLPFFVPFVDPKSLPPSLKVAVIIQNEGKAHVYGQSFLMFIMRGMM